MHPCRTRGLGSRLTPNDKYLQVHCYVGKIQGPNPIPHAHLTRRRLRWPPTAPSCHLSRRPARASRHGMNLNEQLANNEGIERPAVISSGQTWTPSLLHTRREGGLPGTTPANEQGTPEVDITKVTAVHGGRSSSWTPVPNAATQKRSSNRKHTQ